MKNILITGANSFIGTSVEAWLLRNKNNNEYKVNKNNSL